jgi:hypothetical protein
MYTGNGTMDDHITIVNNGTGLSTMPIGSLTVSNTVGSTISFPKATTEYILDTYEMNQVVVEHKLQEQELMKLREADVNFADHIKSNLTKVAAGKIVQKMSFTKWKDTNMDVTHFRGRVWVFTKEELEQLIKDAQNA